MQAALGEALGANLDRADALIMSAAVSDYRFAETLDHKHSRREQPFAPRFESNPDILAALGAQRTRAWPVLVGFTVGTDPENLVASARSKLLAKRVDLMVANLAADSLGLDDNRITLVTGHDEVAWPTVSKLTAARAVLDWISRTLGALS